MQSIELDAAPDPVRRDRRNGDADDTSFSELLYSLRPDVLRFSYWLARDRSIAEDIVQETLLRAWRSREALHDREAARAWLLTIARREHARTYERKRLELVSLDEGLDEPQAALRAGGAGGDAEYELEELRDAILKLPIAYRQPLVMQVFGGFTTKEIARELGLSLTAVLTRLFRARSALQKLCNDNSIRPQGSDHPTSEADDTRVSRRGRGEGADVAESSAPRERPRPEIETARSSA